jgi:hypothetical protein
MSKPETLKDMIDETMRVSGVSYKVPADNIIKTWTSVVPDTVNSKVTQRLVRPLSL